MGAASRTGAALYLAWPSPGHTGQVPSKGGAGPPGPGVQGGARGGWGSRKERGAWRREEGPRDLGEGCPGVGGERGLLGLGGSGRRACLTTALPGDTGGSSWWRPGLGGRAFWPLSAPRETAPRWDWGAKGRCARRGTLQLQIR